MNICGSGRRVALGLLAVLAPFALGAAPPTEPVAIYVGMTLIDGSGAAPQTGMAVVTRGEAIAAVVPEAELDAAIRREATVHDLSGRYLLPGLIDAHQHLATPPDRPAAEASLRRSLASGITGVRIMADDLRSIAELDRAARNWEIAGPDLHYSALVAGPGFFDDPRTAAAAKGWAPGTAPWMQAIDGGSDLRLALARARGTGAVALKIYADLPPRLVNALSAEAHRQGLKVWAHGMVFPTRPAQVIAAGPDTVSHSCYLGYQKAATPPARYRDRSPLDPAWLDGDDDPVMARLFDDMRRRGIVLDATLRVYRELERTSAAAGRTPYCTLDLAARLTRQAHRHGVLIAAGTDGDTPPGARDPALFDELELLVGRAGLSPMDAIRAATSVAARAAGQEGTIGTVAPGRLANMVVLARDPLADIANMRSAVATVKRGRMIPRP